MLGCKHKFSLHCAHGLSSQILLTNDRRPTTRQCMERYASVKYTFRLVQCFKLCDLVKLCLRNIQVQDFPQ